VTGDETDETDGFDEVWRPGRLGRVAAVSVGASGGLLSALSLAAAVTGAGAGGLLAAVVFGLFPVFAWRWGTHPLLAVSTDGVVVRNPLRTVVVPWADVEQCVPSSLGLLIERRSGGRPVVAWAVPKSNLSRWRGRPTAADEVAAALEERAAASQPS
jgi:hypothetical protein